MGIFFCHSSLYFSETGYFIEYGACYLDQAGWPVSPGDPTLSTPPGLNCRPKPPRFDFYVHNKTAMPGFHMVVISSLANEPSP